MNIFELPINDFFAQYYRSCLKYADKEKSERLNELRKVKVNHCNHEFVVLKDEEKFDDEYIPKQVQCVHCGLTNKFIDFEKKYGNIKKEWASYFTTDYEIAESFENKLFKEVYNYDENFNFDILPYISKEVLNTYHPELLYILAKQINPEANNEELFKIMSSLNEMETTQEKLRLKYIEQTQKLLNRYYNRTENNKNLYKKKKL